MSRKDTTLSLKSGPSRETSNLSTKSTKPSAQSKRKSTTPLSPKVAKKSATANKADKPEVVGKLENIQEKKGNVLASCVA